MKNSIATDLTDPTHLSSKLLEQYLAGTLDPATMRQVRAVLEATDRQRAYLAGIRAAIRAEDLATLPALDRTWEKLATHMHAPTSALPSSRRSSRPRSRTLAMRRGVIGLAGVAILLAGALLLSPIGATLFAPDTSTAHYVTRPGQRATVTLADGSTLLLAPATSVTVAPHTITVIGEAYFTIVPRASRAMVVQTRNAAVQILGTRFLVRQYEDESISRVMVEDGRVALRARQRDDVHPTQTIVSARMLAQVSDSGVTVSSGISTREYTGWTQGTLVFDRAPLRDVVKDLARAYGADVRIADTLLASKRISVEFDVFQKPLTQVLWILGQTMGAHVEMRSGVYVLLPGRRDVDLPNQSVPLNRFPQPEKQYGR